MREDDREDAEHVPTRSWSELQRRFDQVDQHVQRGSDKLDKLTDRVHAIETQLAGGPQFPLWAKGLVGMFLLNTGAGIWWAGALDQKVQQVPDLSNRLTSAFQAMRNSDTVVGRMEEEHNRIQSAVDVLVKKAMENQERSITCCGEMQALKERCTALADRTTALEQRSHERDKWWQAVWSSGLIKGLKQ